MEKLIGIIIGALVVSIIGWLLAPIFVSFVASSGLGAVNYTGSGTEDFTWAGKLAVVFYYLTIALLPASALFFVIKNMSK